TTPEADVSPRVLQAKETLAIGTRTLCIFRKPLYNHFAATPEADVSPRVLQAKETPGL
ncbi:16748_t:CDS:1, partial [Funneliformis geosporum]